jgi:nitrite reductase (NO-forming)
MDLRPLPAKVSGRRNAGALAQGDSLSFGAVLKRLDPAPVKRVQLDTSHRIVEIAPGVNFSAWTCGGTVPGPGCARMSAIAFPC